MTNLFQSELKVINIGLKSFKETLDKQNVKSVHVGWKPPMFADSKILDVLIFQFL